MATKGATTLTSHFSEATNTALRQSEVSGYAGVSNTTPLHTYDDLDRLTRAQESGAPHQ